MQCWHSCVAFATDTSLPEEQLRPCFPALRAKLIAAWQDYKDSIDRKTEEEEAEEYSDSDDENERLKLDEEEREVEELQHRQQQRWIRKNLGQSILVHDTKVTNEDEQ